jgi:hypothetical protein
MRLNASIFLLMTLLVSGIGENHSKAWEFSGNMTGEYRYFHETPVRADQEDYNFSGSITPECYFLIADSRDSVLFKLFGRIDQNDSNRTHVDIRELKWNKVSEWWELTIGINTVFWGVTETAHLVNIINQVDMVENPDEEDMLGQPMVNLVFVTDWGNFSFFVLPGFRERTFPGRKGRPGSIFILSEDPVYESDSEEWHTDTAFRYSHTFGPWDVGISHFYGTSRDPRFDITLYEINSKGEVELKPIYEIINQNGLDLQCTLSGWMLKFEGIYRSGQGDSFYAFASGFEYTFEDIFSLGMDTGIFCEYLYDERDTEASDNDLAGGLRFTLNDIQSTEFILAVIQDIENHSRYYYMEASRRIGNAFRLTAEIRGVDNVDKADPLIEFEKDQYFQVALGYYF